MKISLVTFIVLAGLLLAVQAYQQEVTLYESLDDSGNFHVYRSQIPDSTFLGSRIRRLCLYGTWNFYTNVNYETRGGGWYSFDGKRYCVSIYFSIASFRFGGANDTEVSAATFYSGSPYEGVQTTVTGLAHGDMVAQSFAITGSDSWTIYEGSDFDVQGQRVCITPHEPSFISFEGALLSGWSNYGSVAKGCDADVPRLQNSRQSINGSTYTD